ncbi:hypothetical protein [Pseudomonas fluorescens]|uniref:hypothetical protein n=1 Tax=Pseudomonas fluorescens TaxID=294 RepID=UPI001FD69957|nr:hypothetical protein [Pseudomonas fluorescens]
MFDSAGCKGGKMLSIGLIDSGSHCAYTVHLFTDSDEFDIKVLLGGDCFLGYALRYKGTTYGEGIVAVSLYLRFTAVGVNPAFCHFAAESALPCRHDQPRRFAVQQRPAAMQCRQ